MKRVFSHNNLAIVYNIKNILEINQIECLLRNELISSAAGEVPPTDAWPEVWVQHAADEKKAENLINEALNGDPTKTSWLCGGCGETNAPAFEVCWQCGYDPESS